MDESLSRPDRHREQLIARPPFRVAHITGTVARFASPETPITKRDDGHEMMKTR